MSSSKVWGGSEDEDWLGSVDWLTLTELGEQTFGSNWGKWLVGSFEVDQNIFKKV